MPSTVCCKGILYTRRSRETPLLFSSWHLEKVFTTQALCHPQSTYTRREPPAANVAVRQDLQVYAREPVEELIASLFGSFADRQCQPSITKGRLESKHIPDIECPTSLRTPHEPGQSSHKPSPRPDSHHPAACPRTTRAGSCLGAGTLQRRMA